MGDFIKHDEFISNYQLRRSEYCLLPKEMRLTYLDILYREIVDECKEKGSAIRSSYIQEACREYFEACGCEVINFDFGIEQFEIKRVRDNHFTPTEENKKLVSEYVKFVAEARWEILLTAIKDALYDELGRLSKGIVVDPNFNIKGLYLSSILTDDTHSPILAEEIKKELVEKELDYCTNFQEELEMNRFIDETYIDELKARGYDITRNGNTIIARILK